MNYQVARNSVIFGLLALGVGLWGSNTAGLNATGVNTSYGSQSGDISGEFETSGFNNPTIIHSISINGDIGYNYGYLQPLEIETISFDVRDLDGFDGLEVELKLFFDTDHSGNTNLVEITEDYLNTYYEYEGNATLDAAYDAHTATDVDGDAFVLSMKDGASSSEYFEVVYAAGAAGNTTWGLSSATNGYQESLDGYERAFTVDFRVSKVAKYTYSDQWTLGIRVLNTSTQDVVTESFYTAIDMDWYGEIVIPNATVDFNGELTVTSGSEYGNNTDVIEDVLFIANGEFDQLIGTDEYWDSDKSHPNGGFYSATAAYDETGLTNAQYFHMVASDTSASSNFTSLTTVRGYGYASETVKSHQGTSEAGILLDYYLYLKTATNFQNGTYTGTIYLGIQNSNYLD